MRIKRWFNEVFVVLPYWRQTSRQSIHRTKRGSAGKRIADADLNNLQILSIDQHIEKLRDLKKSTHI